MAIQLTKSYVQSEVETIFRTNIDSMRLHTSQQWFRAALKLGATFSAERQLKDFANDFFAKAFIIRGDEIIGGFGYSIDEFPPKYHSAGIIEVQNQLWYKQYVEEDIVVTFQVNTKGLLSKYPAISSIHPKNHNAPDINFRNLYIIYLHAWELLLISFAISRGLSLLLSYLVIKKEKVLFDFQIHDRRSNDFSMQLLSHRIKKFIHSGNSIDQIALEHAINSIDNELVIHERIFKNIKLKTKSCFILDQEIRNVFAFFKNSYPTERITYQNTCPGTKVETDINSFTVTLVNLLKNSLREILDKPQEFILFTVMEASDQIVLNISNKGKIEKKSLLPRHSSRNSSGLGFAIIKEQTKKMGFILRITNVKDMVVFSFSLKKWKAYESSLKNHRNF